MPTAYAKVENLVKVAALKDAEGHVRPAPRMQRASFIALVSAGWIKREIIERGAFDRVTRFSLTPAGEEKVASYQPEDVFTGLHGQKALETFKRMGTDAADWFHPAIRWVEELRWVPGLVTCPECHGNKWVRHTAEGKVIPPPARVAYGAPGHFEAERAVDEYMRAARAEKASGSFQGNCARCAKHKRGWGMLSQGKIPGIVQALVMVGYVIWPKGVEFKSRFHYGTSQNVQCGICGKAIQKSFRVPLAHDKAGKALGMFVGQDCARKFAKVAVLKPSNKENAKGLDAILDENYEVSK